VRQADKRQRTRSAVLDSAESEFSKHGYHGATLREIADAAGVSTGALYYNFTTKEELFLALLEVRMEERIREIQAAFAAEQPGETPVTRSALDYIQNLKRNRDWITLFFEFVAHAGRQPEFRARFAELFKRFWRALAEIIEERTGAHGIALPLPPQQVAIAIDLTGIGFMLPQIIDSDAVPDDLLSRTLAYMLQGMAQGQTNDRRP
jgi:AcrR family transcriptional regulator